MSGFGNYRWCWDRNGQRSAMKRTTLSIMMLLMVVLAASCGSDGDAEPPFEVSSVVISHETGRGHFGVGSGC